ncbi:unnamed protein product [Amoebophrya sp. A25]|nr:unnamed protein product [Amoebophrya sp. A25]|eukprot:GSA25T00003592001.1
MRVEEENAALRQQEEAADLLFEQVNNIASHARVKVFGMVQQSDKADKNRSQLHLHQQLLLVLAGDKFVAATIKRAELEMNLTKDQCQSHLGKGLVHLLNDQKMRAQEEDVKGQYNLLQSHYKVDINDQNLGHAAFKSIVQDRDRFRVRVQKYLENRNTDLESDEQQLLTCFDLTRQLWEKSEKYSSELSRIEATLRAHAQEVPARAQTKKVPQEAAGVALAWQRVREKLAQAASRLAEIQQRQDNVRDTLEKILKRTEERGFEEEASSALAEIERLQGEMDGALTEILNTEQEAVALLPEVCLEVTGCHTKEELRTLVELIKHLQDQLGQRRVNIDNLRKKVSHDIKLAQKLQVNQAAINAPVANSNSRRAIPEGIGKSNSRRVLEIPEGNGGLMKPVIKVDPTTTDPVKRQNLPPQQQQGETGNEDEPQNQGGGTGGVDPAPQNTKGTWTNGGIALVVSLSVLGAAAVAGGSFLVYRHCTNKASTAERAPVEV